MHEQARLLLDVLDGHEAHVGPGDGFADGGGVGRVVLAAPAAHAIGGDELGRHQAHGVAELGELARPVVRARAGFHADEAGRQCGDEFEQLGARHCRAHQLSFAARIDAVDDEDRLCKIDSDGYDGHDFPFQVS